MFRQLSRRDFAHRALRAANRRIPTAYRKPWFFARQTIDQLTPDRQGLDCHVAELESGRSQSIN
jgi:hypothetical protein